MANMTRAGTGANQYVKRADTSNEASAQVSREAASRLMNVSTASVERVRRAEKKAEPEVVEAMKEGKISVGGADVLAVGGAVMHNTGDKTDSLRRRGD
jgi:hypothetical protein